MDWNDVNMYEHEQELAAYYFAEGIAEAHLLGLNEDERVKYADAYVATMMRITV